MTGHIPDVPPPAGACHLPAGATGTAGSTAPAGTAGTASGDPHVKGPSAGGRYTVDVDPVRAGWGYSSLRVLTLPPGGSHSLDTGDSEWIVLPLSGGCTVTLTDAPGVPDVREGPGVPDVREGPDAPGAPDAPEAPDEPDGPRKPEPTDGSNERDGDGDGPHQSHGPPGPTFLLHGRDSVFDAVTDFAYLPRDAHARIASESGGRFALTGARCERRLPARYGPASAVPVELRGTGSCSRQVNNFGAAGVFECDRLIAVEVLTPGGNWSSYPPHKHDEQRPGEESELEEIYYFEIAEAHGSAGLGYQRVSPSGRGRGTDVLAEVRTGDVVLIPDGWHGPSIAAPGHTMYYLNVMAGPGPERAWLIRDHPDHAWIRDTWTGRPADPRLPLYTAPAAPADPPDPADAPGPAGPLDPAGPPDPVGPTRTPADPAHPTTPDPTADPAHPTTSADPTTSPGAPR
jgi:5-deoxy-glucuronate isomerase